MPKFTVHIRRTWDERFQIEVEADSAEEAKDVARLIENEEGIDFDWDNVEHKDTEIMFVDDANGNEVFNLDDEETK